MHNLKVKNFHVVSPITSIFTTKANHLGEMVRWGGSGLIFLENKMRHNKLKENMTIIVNHYKTIIVGM
jgi:hypothetical protein